MKEKHIGPITDLFTEYCRAGNFCLTKNSTLLGAVELDGVDPDGLTKDDFWALSQISRAVYSNLPESVKSVTQYYVHLENAKIKLKDRNRKISHYLSKRRQKFLEGKNLSASRIIHFFEIKPNENLTKLSPFNFVKHAALATKVKKSREILKRYLSTEQSIMVYEEDLQRQVDELEEVLSDVQARWDMVSGCRILNTSQLWSFLRLMANMKADELWDAVDDKIPDDEWDAHLADGDIKPVRIDNVDFLKFHGVENSYARILSVTRFIEEDEHLEPGIWANKKYSPTRKNGNYIIMSRYLPFSRRQQKKLFTDKKNALERKNLNLTDILKGTHEGLTKTEKRKIMKRSIREKLEALEEAEGLEERWGKAQSSIIVFNESAKKINKHVKGFVKSLRVLGIKTINETIDLPYCFSSIMPGGSGFSLRNMDINSTQFGALSLINRAHEGQITVEDLGNEESQYVLQSVDGTAFHFSPYVGGLSIVLGNGPPRTGKTFLKNSVASHFLKYGGLYRGIDIDPGTEPVAKFFKDDGAIFRMEDNRTRGFNLFTSARGIDDAGFFAHLREMIMQMINSNDEERLRTLADGDQEQIDFAAREVLKLPKNLQCLSALVGLCNKSVKSKLNRWYGNGAFASLFDQGDDAIGSIDKQIAVFNLASIKDDKLLLPLAMTEIFFRLTRAFEDKATLGVPNFVEVDEAHAILKYKYVSDYLIRGARTWGKWLGGVGLWSQFPAEFKKMPDWDGLRASATTFVFTANVAMNPDEYRSVYDLTPGECDAIKNLRPRKEAYIIQRELGISKAVIVEAEPEQYVINTSKPSEWSLRDRLIEEHGYEKGLKETVLALNLESTSNERAA